MARVGDWVDHVIMMPDFTSEDLLQTMEIFLVELNQEVKPWIQNIDDETFDTSQTMDKTNKTLEILKRLKRFL